jgi:MFS family permease
VSAPAENESSGDVVADADLGPGAPGPGLPATPLDGPPSDPLPRGFTSLQPLRHRNYALLWSGGLVSIIGSWMQTVAVGALVASHTGSALWVVVVAAGGFLPIGVLSPVGGALADRMARRPVLIAGNLAAGGVALVIALLVAAHEYGPLALTALVTAQGCVSAVIGPFQQAILPDLVPRSEFLAASSLNSAQFNLGRVVGPALAGATVLAFGYPMAFVANAISFLAVVLALAFVHLAPPPPAPPEGRPSLVISLRFGFSAAMNEPGCRAAIILIAVVALLASPFIALVPAVAHRLSHGGSRAVASATALLTTSQGVGAVLGALMIAPLAVRFGRGRMLMAALFALAPALILYDFAPWLGWAVAMLFLVGVIYIGVLSGLSTVVQLRAPSEFRGRVLSLYLVALGVAYPIGSLVEGPIADRFGLPWTTASAAGVLLVLLCVMRVARADLFKELGSG